MKLKRIASLCANAVGHKQAMNCREKKATQEERMLDIYQEVEAWETITEHRSG